MTVLEQTRLTRYGLGMFLTGLSDDEIAISDAAKTIVRNLQQRSGLMALEIFYGPRVIAWPGDPSGIRASPQETSCCEHGRAWLVGIPSKHP